MTAESSGKQGLGGNGAASLSLVAPAQLQGPLDGSLHPTFPQCSLSSAILQGDAAHLNNLFHNADSMQEKTKADAK